MSMKISLKRMKLNNNRKLFIIGGVSIALLLLGGYIAASSMAWSAFNQKTDETVGAIRTVADSAFKQKTPDVSSRDKKIKAIEMVHTRILQYEQCNISGFYAWQEAIVASYKTSMQRCKAQAKQLHAFSDAVNNLIVYLKNERKLADILHHAVASSALDEAEWGAEIQKWVDIEKNVSQLSSVGTFSKSKEAALLRIKSIIAVWQELISANQAKDRKKYEAAAGRLGQSYTMLREVKDISEIQIGSLVKNLDDTYKQTFKN